MLYDIRQNVEIRRPGPLGGDCDNARLARSTHNRCQSSHNGPVESSGRAESLNVRSACDDSSQPSGAHESSRSKDKKLMRSPCELAIQQEHTLDVKQGKKLTTSCLKNSEKLLEAHHEDNGDKATEGHSRAR